MNCDLSREQAEELAAPVRAGRVQSVAVLYEVIDWLESMDLHDNPLHGKVVALYAAAWLAERPRGQECYNGSEHD